MKNLYLQGIWIFLSMGFAVGILFAREGQGIPPVKVQSVTGEPTIQRGDKRMIPRAGDPLEKGDLIESGPGATVEIRGDKGFLTRLGARSQALFDMEGAYLMCKTGIFLIESVNPDQTLKVEMPRGILQVKKATVLLEIFEDGGYEVTVLGAADYVQVDARFGSKDYMTLLTTGQIAQFEAGENYSVQIGSRDVPELWKNHALGEVMGAAQSDVIALYTAQNPGKSGVETVDGIRIFSDKPQGEIKGIILHFGGDSEWIEGWYSGWFKEFPRKGVMMIIPELPHFGRRQSGVGHAPGFNQDLTKAIKKYLELHGLTKYAMVLSCGSLGAPTMHAIFQSKELPNPIVGAAIHSGGNFFKPGEVQHLLIASPKPRVQPQQTVKTIPVVIEGFQKQGEVTTYVDSHISWHHVFQDQMLAWLQKEKVFGAL